MKNFLVLSLVAVATLGFSQNLRPVPFGQIQRVEADAFVMLDAQQRPISPVIPVEASFTNAPTWQVSFDSMNTNPGSQASYADFYGNDNGPSAFADEYRNFVWVNDANINPASYGRLGRMVRIALVWNPGGGTSLSGSANLALEVFFAKSVGGSDSAPAFTSALPGVLILRNNLAAGLYEVQLDMSALGFGLQLPTTPNAAIVVRAGTHSSGSFVNLNPASNAVQPMLSPMMSAGQPQFPGTNPSSSDAFAWVDEATPGLIGQNRPNYILENLTTTGNSSFPYSERFSYDYTLDNAGWLQPAAAIFADSTAKRITGNFVFNGLSDPAATQPSRAEIQVRNSSGTTIYSQEVVIGPGGAFSVDAPNALVAGTYQVYAKIDHWLGKLSSAVTTATATTSVGSLSLKNGDVNNDDEVGAADFSVLASAYDAVTGDPNFVAFADLNRDGEVGAADFSILAANYDEVGD